MKNNDYNQMGLRMVNYKSNPEIYCECGSSNVKIITKTEIENDEENTIKIYRVQKTTCLDCGEKGIYDKKELEIINNPNDKYDIKFKKKEV